MDNATKRRILEQLRPLLAKSQKFKHYGVVTDKVYAVGRALLWDFHNSKTGVCYPSIRRIAQKANCSDWLVKKAIKILEMIGWVVKYNRSAIAWLYDETLGRYRNRRIRTSNCYVFNAGFSNVGKSYPLSSKGGILPKTQSKNFCYSLDKLVGEALTRLASDFSQKALDDTSYW